MSQIKGSWQWEVSVIGWGNSIVYGDYSDDAIENFTYLHPEVRGIALVGLVRKVGPGDSPERSQTPMRLTRAVFELTDPEPRPIAPDIRRLTRRQ